MLVEIEKVTLAPGTESARSSYPAPGFYIDQNNILRLVGCDPHRLLDQVIEIQKGGRS